MQQIYNLNLDRLNLLFKRSDQVFFNLSILFVQSQNIKFRVFFARPPSHLDKGVKTVNRIISNNTTALGNVKTLLSYIS